MAERSISTLFEGGGFFEGPRWRDGTWWVSDFYRHTVSRIGTDGADKSVGVSADADGVVVASVENGHAVLRRYDFDAGGKLQPGAVRDLGDLQGGDLAGMGAKHGAQILDAEKRLIGHAVLRAPVLSDGGEIWSTWRWSQSSWGTLSITRSCASCSASAAAA